MLKGAVTQFLILPLQRHYMQRLTALPHVYIMNILHHITVCINDSTATQPTPATSWAFELKIEWFAVTAKCHESYPQSSLAGRLPTILSP